MFFETLKVVWDKNLRIKCFSFDEFPDWNIPTLGWVYWPYKKDGGA